MSQRDRHAVPVPVVDEERAAGADGQGVGRTSGGRWTGGAARACEDRGYVGAAVLRHEAVVPPRAAVGAGAERVADLAGFRGIAGGVLQPPRVAAGGVRPVGCTPGSPRRATLATAQPATRAPKRVLATAGPGLLGRAAGGRPTGSRTRPGLGRTVPRAVQLRRRTRSAGPVRAS